VTTRRILFATKALRTFGDGMMAILLAHYFDVLGFSGLEAGLVGSAALVGTSAATFLVGRYVERLGRKRVLVWGALLSIATGFAYAGSTEFVLLAVVAFFGTANPTSGDVSAFLPVEQAILAQEATGDSRVRTFARFNIVGALAAAAGAGASAATVLIDRAPGVGEEGAIRWLFLGYALLGLATLLLVLRLTPHAELAQDAPRGGLGPSKRRVFTLSALFGLDSFAGGIVVQSVIALYLLREYNLSPATTGLVFTIAGLFQAVSFIVSSRLSTRFGLVNTMVFTHLPSNALLAGVAFAPNVEVAVAFLLLRALLSQMDVPPRQTLVMSVVQPEERAAAAAYTGLTRSLSSTAGPSVGGALLGTWAGAPFLACALLKSTYDLALFGLFRNVERE
jgi:MFS family permease